jgi:hypothetical protein
VSFRIPPRTVVGVAQSKRTRQVDHAHARVDQRWRELGGGTIRQREEDDVGVRGERIRRKGCDDPVPEVRQRRQAAR